VLADKLLLLALVILDHGFVQLKVVSQIFYAGSQYIFINADVEYNFQKYRNRKTSIVSKYHNPMKTNKSQHRSTNNTTLNQRTVLNTILPCDIR